ncbi:MAG: hypothetical protein ACREH8_12625 [Opitutaceae bacterium]
MHPHSLAARVSGQPARPGGRAALRQAAAASDHAFWPAAVSLTDARRFDLTRVPHPRHCYL